MSLKKCLHILETVCQSPALFPSASKWRRCTAAVLFGAERVPLSSEAVNNKLVRRLVISQTAERDAFVCVNRVGSGHYTAYGSHEGHWYHFNDSTVTLTNEDTVRKAKAYILFYVEKAGEEQVVSDKPAVDNICPEAAAPDKVSADDVATDMVLTDAASSRVHAADVAATDNAALENEGEDMAAPHDADKASAQAATDSDTSDESRTEEASQAIQAVAQ